MKHKCKMEFPPFPSLDVIPEKGEKKSYVVFLTTWIEKKQKKKMSMAAEMTVQTENT